jgi:hypothetical protein
MKLKKVHSLEAIPELASEEEEARFWAEHGLGEALLEAMSPPRRASCPRPVPGAGSSPCAWTRTSSGGSRPWRGGRARGYQTLLKEFVLERLYEEEKREGFI